MIEKSHQHNSWYIGFGCCSLYGYCFIKVVVMTDRKILNQRVLIALLLVVVVTAVIMFGFGFSLVPLYDILCEVTGLNGKTACNQSTGGKIIRRIQDDRLVKVQFVTNVAVGLPWRFKALEKELFVRPGNSLSPILSYKSKPVKRRRKCSAERCSFDSFQIF